LANLREKTTDKNRAGRLIKKKKEGRGARGRGAWPEPVGLLTSTNDEGAQECGKGENARPMTKEGTGGRVEKKEKGAHHIKTINVPEMFLAANQRRKKRGPL